MAETRPHQRVFALVVAILFFAFSFAASFTVIWQLYKDNKEAKTVNQTSATDTSQKKKLQGTKLANFTPVAHVDQLQIIDTKVGSGSEVKPGGSVVADYNGAIAATGIIFQSSFDSGKPVPFSLSGVIKGWADGIPGMKVGGQRRLLIPAAQAFGANPPQGSGIPPNADLVFDVTLQSIGK